MITVSKNAKIENKGEPTLKTKMVVGKWKTK